MNNLIIKCKKKFINKFFCPFFSEKRLKQFICRIFFKTVLIIFYLFVNNYLNIYKLNNFNQFLNAKEIKINQIKYDKYSFEKDPADKLFKSFFGEKWTKKFINKFLFTLNNEIIN